jgi:hypothetical protein
MKHVSETLLQFKDDLFFNILYESTLGVEEVKDEMTPEEKAKLAKELEKQGLGIVKKLNANFSIFKSIALDDWRQYRDFWNEQKTSKEAQGIVEGIFYKLYDSKYLVGVLKTEDGTAELTVWNSEVEDGFDDHVVFKSSSAVVIKKFMEFYKNTFESEMRNVISKEKEKMEQNKAEAVKKEKEEAQIKAKEKVNAFMTESLNEDIHELLNYFINVWTKDKGVRDEIFNSDQLWEKYKKFFDPNFDWLELSEEDLVELWDEWEADTKETNVVNEAKKQPVKKGAKSLTVPTKPNPANKTTPSKPPKNKKKK